MARPKRPEYGFNIDEYVTYLKRKAKIVDRWWDEYSSNRYSIRYTVGKNLTGTEIIVLENQLQRYTK